MFFVVDRQWFVISFPFIKSLKNIQILNQLKMYKSDIEVMAKAKNHTDNIDSVTLGNIKTNSAFVKWFISDCDIYVVEWYVRQS